MQETEPGLIMEESREYSSDTFTSAMTLSQRGVDSLPKRYILPQTLRPTVDPKVISCPTKVVPVIDISFLENPFLRSQVIEEIRVACKEFGVFQVINHGIPSCVTNEALDVAAEFFDMPNETKMSLASGDVSQPVRYGTSLNHTVDKVQYWRDFLKHYCNPISTWIEQWPSNPPTYKKKMGNYAKAVHILHTKLMEAVFESLALRADYLQNDIEQGSQVMAVNCYPACPEPSLALGLPPHSDYGMLAILLQNQKGLEIMDSNKKWQSVPLIKDALIVQLGDQMEVLSNGYYKGVVHRATLNSDKRRLSISSLHSLAMEKKVIPAPELVNEQHPSAYKECSFGDFLRFVSDNDIVEGSYIDTLRNQSKGRVHEAD